MEDLPRVIEELYDISVERISKIRYGYTNKKFLIRSRDNKYIARVSSLNRINHLQFELNVLNRLQEYRLEFQVPKIVKTLDGKDFGILESKKCAVTLFNFIPGSQAFRLWTFPFGSNGMSNDLGLKVGTIHETFSRMKNPKDGREHTHIRLVESYLDTFKEYVSIMHSLHRKPYWETLLVDEMELIVSETGMYLDYLQDSRNQTMLIHTDLRLENMLVRKERIAAICDFDDILIGDQAYDLAKIFVEIYSDRGSLPERLEDFDIRGFKTFAFAYTKARNGNDRELVRRMADYLGLAALHVLSIVGRDPSFDNKVRAWNVRWYSNFLKFTRNENNLNWIRSKLDC